MSLIQTPWTSQPQHAVGIDWSNPITRGLVDAIISADLRSVVNGVQAVTTGTVSNAVGSNGRIRQTPAGGSNKDAYTGAWSRINAPLTLVTMYRITNAAYASRISGNLAASSYGYGLAPNTTNFRAIVARSGVNTVLTGSSVNTSLKVDTLTIDATNARFYENGRLTAGPTAHGGMATPTGDFTFGSENGASNTDGADYYFAVLFNRVLSDAEIRSISQNPWQIVKPFPRRIFVPVAAGGSDVTITGNIGNATAAGLTASVSQATSIAAGVGNSVAAGSQASVSQRYTLSAGIGNATAAGLTATITASGLTTISCTTGNAAAAGSTATVNSAATVTCSVGNAAAAGLTAALDTAFTILANVGNATADGLSATIQAATGISCGVANAIAAGLTASVTNNAPLTDSEKIDLILDILSNRQTLDPVTGIYTLYADDSVTVLKTAQAWEDAAGTIPYRGRALQRLDGMN